jgi:general secretion pathway protein F
VRFLLKAVNPDQAVVALELEAADEAAAREAAQRQGLSVLALRAPGFPQLTAPPRRNRFRATLFSIELLALLDAGLNLVEALQALAEKNAPGESRSLLRGLLQSIGEGLPFSQAIARHPQHFSSLYVATLQSSERTGNVRDALARFIAYEEEVDRVRKKVVAALIYPAILTVVGGAVLAFLLFYVVPRFAGVYEGMDSELPLFSSLLLAAGGFVKAHGVAVLVALTAIVGLATYALSEESTRAWVAKRLWQAPALGERMRVYQLARFYRSAGMLLRAGISAPRAFDMVSGLLAAHLRQSLSQARTLLEEGKSISVALTTAGLATPVATRMMAVGERGGRMGEMMDRIARFYDDETARAVDAFTRIFEPVLMAVLGLAVGGVVVLMYMPVFELAGSIR